ncbi:ALP1-like protein [Tanacetum coccineum]
MNNDVNVLRQSPIFNDLITGRAPDVPFVANNVPYKRGYYLTDGIYPQWSVLIKSIKNPGTNDHKRILYKTKHEAARKDLERAFGVLNQKWKIIKYPARGLTQSRLSDIMYTCIILHNMIIHDNCNAISPDFFPEEQHRDDDPACIQEISKTRRTVKRIRGLIMRRPGGVLKILFGGMCTEEDWGPIIFTVKVLDAILFKQIYFKSKGRFVGSEPGRVCMEIGLLTGDAENRIQLQAMITNRLWLTGSLILRAH